MCLLIYATRVVGGRTEQVRRRPKMSHTCSIVTISVDRLGQENCRTSKSKMQIVGSRKISIEKLLEGYAISIILYRIRCWTISSMMKGGIKARESSFYRRMLEYQRRSI